MMDNFLISREWIPLKKKKKKQKIETKLWIFSSLFDL